MPVLPGQVLTAPLLPSFVASQADVAVFEALAGPPPAPLCHALRWFNHIKSFQKEKGRSVCWTGGGRRVPGMMNFS